MWPLNCVKIFFALISFTISIIGISICKLEKYLPAFIIQTARYGKHAYNGDSFIKLIEVPKSSFKQFYELAILVCTYSYYTVFTCYVLQHDVPEYFIWLTTTLGGSDAKSNTKVSATEVLIAMTLLTLQCYRRFYDTHFVSVFGKRSKINLSHYILGMIFYPFVILAILCEAPNFNGTSFRQNLNVLDIHLVDVLAIIIFVWAWWHQHVTTVILANLRKTKVGQVNNDYKLPKGDWFEYLSSPHCSAEMLMYICLTVVLWKNSTWWYVLLWILSNQITTIIWTHSWYEGKFDSFPKRRKAIIPFVY